MSDYIDREEIMRQFADQVWRSNNSDFSQTPTWNQAVQIVEDYPAADVVARDCYDRLLAENDELREERPVRHGRWEKMLQNADGTADYECTACKGLIIDVPDDEEHPLCSYCPSCGAKMDEEDEE